MIFSETWQAVLAGRKTQTRRVVADPATPCRYVVGRTYAVQPGRGKAAVGRIKVMRLRRERLHEITEADAAAEGCDGDCPVGYIPAYRRSPRTYHFASLWDALNPTHPWISNPLVDVIEFELVEGLTK